MPFYRQPVTLKKASTLAILAAIQARPYSEINSCLNIASLPIHLLEEILSLIYENNGIRLKRGTVASYFHENIYNLVLCTSTERFTSREVYFLSAASSKCKNLRSLKIEICCDSRIKIPRFGKYIGHFKQLRNLDLSHARVNDDCLRIVGKNCKSIRYLDVSACYGVTDRGIWMLCYEDNGQLGCSLIEKISIMKTTVTSIGCKTILMSQNNLTTLQSEELISALSDLYQQFRAQNDIRLFHLRQLHTAILKGYTCIEKLYQALTICPQLFISHLKIHYHFSIQGLDVATTPLLPNSIVKKLSFIGCGLCPHFWFPFNPITVPALTAGIGSRLLKLTLVRMENVDTAAIIASCPNIQSLKMSDNISYVYDEIGYSLNANRYLQHLENFKFFGDDPCGDFETFPHESHISLILASPKLKHISIHSCATLTDSSLQAAFTRTGFLCMESVDITYCNSLTKVGLEYFKRRENSISTFSVHSCNQVDFKLLESEWKLFVRNNNWEIEMCFVSDFDEDEEGMQWEID